MSHEIVRAFGCSLNRFQFTNEDFPGYYYLYVGGDVKYYW